MTSGRSATTSQRRLSLMHSPLHASSSEELQLRSRLLTGGRLRANLLRRNQEDASEAGRQWPGLNMMVSASELVGVTGGSPFIMLVIFMW